MDQMTYKGAGVDYDALDSLKRKAGAAVRDTVHNADRLDVSMCMDTLGESVQLFCNGGHYIAHVNEGLGTKNLVADAMDDVVMPGAYYDSIAQDTVAAIINDMVTLGALPFDIKMNLAVGDTKWMANSHRVERLIGGWRWSCNKAGCTWSGGETPVLVDMVAPECAVLSGSAVGKTIGLKRFSSENIRSGDAIIFLESTGIHANGLSMARKIAAKLERKYQTEVPGTRGQNFAHALLQPAPLYAGLVEALIRKGVNIHYAVHITGHGWRKIMRAPQPFTYVIHRAPKPQPVFDFIQEHGNVTDEEMYGTFNMRAGFALMMPKEQLPRFWEVFGVHNFPFGAMEVGVVEAGEKQVVIEHKNLVFKGETLAIR